MLHATLQMFVHMFWIPRKAVAAMQWMRQWHTVEGMDFEATKNVEFQKGSESRHKGVLGILIRYIDLYSRVYIYIVMCSDLRSLFTIYYVFDIFGINKVNRILLITVLIF